MGIASTPDAEQRGALAASVAESLQRPRVADRLNVYVDQLNPWSIKTPSGLT